jgi:small subunit ribosomal protein S5
VLSKSLGSQNPINLVKATITALENLRRPEEVAQLRGLSVGEVLGSHGPKDAEASNATAEPADESSEEPVPVEAT